MARTARTTSRPLVAGALVLALLLVGCGSDELGGKVVKDGLGCTITEADRRADDVPEIDAGAKVGDATKVTDLEKGAEKACKADATKYLTVDLIGATVADGKVFNSTYDDPQPLTVRLGTGQLIQGLETGLADMKVGARRQLLIPAAEAYGETGDEGLGIGKDADLEFVVDLISLTDAPTACNPSPGIPEAEGKPTLADFTLPATPTEGDVKVTVLEEGDGAEVTTKSYPTVDYLGIACSNGQQFDSSWDRGEPIQVALADAEPSATAFSVIQGWTDGLAGQKVGSLVQLDIPSEKGYGEQGNPPAIGPNDPHDEGERIVDTTEEAPADPTTS
ncbi:MAG TPA: FKBP-type peptidyl-prolyl cis-trans isomerase, partial [Aquihabitans sp.]|nr:FKBP-type peptidyl-prolyl cis-trans isomerase [Aquihabitans sp.]